jgi:YHS domain-containing protein
MWHKSIAVLALVCSFVSPVLAAQPVSKDFWAGVAIGGKDSVSYYASDAKKAHVVADGDKRYEVEYLGAKWRFASKQSADKFAASPATYVPQYNGHCANALSTGEGLVKTDGSVWEFFDNKLYLFYAEGGRERWEKGDWRDYRVHADAAWKTIVEGK